MGTNLKKSTKRSKKITMNIDHEKTVSNDKHLFKIKPVPDTNESSGNNKSAKSLGDGRWKYRGKTYKEESIGKS
jgi:hypothetical protein